MKTITYHKNDTNNRFSLNIKDVPSNHPLGALAEFLIQDLGMFGIDWFIEWLEERKDVSVDSTNWEMYSAILENGIISIDPIIYDETVEHNWPCDCNVFQITSEKMIAILKQYKEVRATRPYPNKIIFTQDDNGDVTIDAED